jgi:Zn-dependent peptidase ImmA (M78 family)/DNA-binding XRE family transcriptional regulator
MNASSASAGLPFNPAIFRWARERCGLSVEEVAHSFNDQVEKISQWESGEKTPTVNQARRLAEIYDRPFLEFFAHSIPNVPDVELVPDFRFYPNPPSAMETFALKEVQVWAEEQRLNALSLLQEIGEEAPAWPSNLRFDISFDVEVASHQAREFLEFPISEQLALKSDSKNQLPLILRAKLENAGVLVLKQTGITKLRTRGICMFAAPLPVIVFGGEAPSAQAFTIAHELGHILLGISGISGPPRFGARVKSSSKAVENWCNRFAAAFLMPKSVLLALIPMPETPYNSFDDAKLESLSKHFAVSRHAMMIRLVNLGYVEAAYYWQTKRPQFLKEEESFKSFGRALYYGSRYVNSRGRFYTGLVLGAWEGGYITSHNAAEYMGIKNLEHLRDIRDNFGVVNA